MSIDKLLKSALALSRRYGWAVFPLNGKKPFPGSRSFKDATRKPTKIKNLFAEYPTATGIGVRCSSTRGPIVLDVDGPKGEKAVGKFALPPTLTARSSPGRNHRYF